VNKKALNQGFENQLPKTRLKAAANKKAFKQQKPLSFLKGFV